MRIRVVLAKTPFPLAQHERSFPWSAGQISTGLGALVVAHVSAKTQGASLKLCNLGRRFQELLQLTRLMTVFEICNTEAAAVASFSD